MTLDGALSVVWMTMAATALASGRADSQLEFLTAHGKLREGVKTQADAIDLFRHVTVPKHWFWHFYLIAFAVAVALLEDGRSLGDLLFLLHVLRRLAEQLMLFTRTSRTSRMHLLAYFLGLGFYPLFGLSVWAGRTETSTGLGLCRVAVAIWSVGQLMQFVSHTELARLQTERGGSYGIPTGSLFKWTWSPHYAAEVLIYGSLALVNSGAAVKACLAFVVCSLAVNARNQARWYARLTRKTQA